MCYYMKIVNIYAVKSPYVPCFEVLPHLRMYGGKASCVLNLGTNVS
jgi:hypothetical protein